MEIKVFTGAFIGSSKEVSFIVIYDLPWSAQEKLDDKYLYYSILSNTVA